MLRRLVLLLITVLVATAFAVGDLERGNRLFREGRYAEAVEAYRSALESGTSTPELHYNLGTALLQVGQYEEAGVHLRTALDAIKPDLRERSLYNLGNRYLLDARSAKDPQARRQLLEAAVNAYKETLRVQPNDTDAKWNLELALRDQDELPPMPEEGSGEGDPQEGEAGAPTSGMPNGQPQPGNQDSRSSNGRNSPDHGPLSRDEAERILNAIEQDERALTRNKLRKGQREKRVERDW